MSYQNMNSELNDKSLVESQLYFKNIPEAFDYWVKRQPDNVIAFSEQVAYTYHDMNRDSNKLANFLSSEKGIEPGDRVLICMHKSHQTLIMIMAVLKIGAVYVPVEPDFPESRLKHVIHDSSSRLALSVTEHLSKLPGDIIPIVAVDLYKNNIDSHSGKNPDSRSNNQTAAYIIYTSGSTGMPKGVLIHHGGVLNMALGQRELLSIDEKSIVLQFFSFAFDASVFEVFLTILNGGSIVIEDKTHLLEPDNIIKLINTYGITSLQLPPNILKFIDPHLVKSVRNVMVGGEVYPEDLISRWLPYSNVFNTYGPTECTCCALLNKISDVSEFRTLGNSIPGVSVFILDNELDQVDKGEIYIGGNGVGLGYVNLDELNSEKFIYVDKIGQRLYKTGDLGVRLDNGSIRYLGRDDDQIKISGYRVSTGEVESLIRKLAGIRDVSVVTESATNDKNISHLAAYIVFEDDEPVIQQLRIELRSLMPHYMVPSKIVILNELPRTLNGKIDRKALSENFTDSNYKSQHVETNSKMTDKLLNIWMDVLKLDQVDINDDFFSLGGTSIHLLYLTQEYENKLGHKIPIRYLYQLTTISSLAREIEKMASRKIFEWPEMKQPDLITDAVLPDGVNYADKESGRTGIPFVTGATGFLGAYILRDLLEHKADKVYCLVRANTNQDGYLRIVKKMKDLLLWKESYSDRVVSLCGDITKPDFGLLDDAYKTLSGLVDEIFHCAAQVDFLNTYEGLKSSNIQGTKEVIKFSSYNKTKSINHISTCAVFGTMPFHRDKDIIHETDDINDALGYNIGGYSQTKWVAEKLVLEAKMLGADVRVFRCGFIMGDSVTGVVNTNDFPSLMIKSALEMGCYYHEPLKVENYTPIDYVSRSIVELSKIEGSKNQTFHILNPKSVDNNIFWNLVSEIGPGLKMLRFREWVQKMSLDKTLAIAPLSPLFTDKIYKNTMSFMELYHKQPRFCTNNADGYLSKIGVHCPEVTPTLVQKWMHYYRSTGFIES